MRNSGLEEEQARIKIARRNVINLTFTHDATLMMKVKEESENFGLELNFQKPKVTTPSHITSLQIDGRKVETVGDFILGGPKSLQMVTAPRLMGEMLINSAMQMTPPLWQKVKRN